MVYGEKSEKFLLQISAPLYLVVGYIILIPPTDWADHDENSACLTLMIHERATQKVKISAIPET